MPQKTNKSNGVLISVIIGVSIIISFSILGFVWQKNSKDVSDRQLQELQLELEQQRLFIKQQNIEDSENEKKREDYFDCFTKGFNSSSNWTTKDLEMLRTICKDKTGFQE